MLIASDESGQTETQKHELSSHLFLFLHFENQQFQCGRNLGLLLLSGRLLVQLSTNSDDR